MRAGRDRGFIVPGQGHKAHAQIVHRLQAPGLSLDADAVLHREQGRDLACGPVSLQVRHASHRGKAIRTLPAHLGKAVCLLQEEVPGVLADAELLGAVVRGNKGSKALQQRPAVYKLLQVNVPRGIFQRAMLLLHEKQRVAVQVNEQILHGAPISSGMGWSASISGRYQFA